MPKNANKIEHILRVEPSPGQSIDKLVTYNTYRCPGDQGRPTAKPKAAPPKPQPLEVVTLRPAAIPLVQPERLSEALALKIVRLLAADTENIVVIPYGKARARGRGITRRQIELCVQKGTITEGPFVNQHGNWVVPQFETWRS